MTIVIKQTFETQIILENDEVSIIQIGSGYDENSIMPPDQIISFPIVHLDAVIAALQGLKG